MKFIPLLFLVLFSLPSRAGTHPPKIIRVEVGSNAVSQIGRDTVFLEDLARDIQIRLWKSYLGTGRSYDRIDLSYEEGTAPGIRFAAREAVMLGQQKALDQICLDKHKKLFAALSKGQQQKIRKQFPVLFQELTP